MPLITPSSNPPVSPNEWKIGSGLNAMSAAVKSKLAAICAMLLRRLAWVRTTPLGAPSDPDVNRTTAGSRGEGEESARPRMAKARSLSKAVAPSRRSSSQTKRT